ncbi:MAG TPA: hypothetical protein VE978_18820 [Chitinophagales bacterium]|nr:hypothetical protein [Chitinophagales bacterium]
MKNFQLHSRYLSPAMILLNLLFSSPEISAQTKSPVKTETEFSLETKGGKEIQIKRHFKAYDEQGNLVDEIDYDSDGKFKEETKTEYNAKKQKVKEIHFISEGKIDEISTYEYDSKGNRISKTVTDENGKLQSKKKWTYEYY